MAYIDAHAHLARGDRALKALLATMDVLGIERAIVVPGQTVTPRELSRRIQSGGEADVAIDNDTLVAQCQTSGGRLLPFFFANPHRGPGAYLKRGHAFRGLKLGPAVHGVPFDDPRTIAFVEAAAALGHPIYAHCLARPGFTVEDFAALAVARPRQRFILGHAGIGTCDFQAIDAIADVRNIWFETSGGFTAVVREAVEKLGISRILFGSEYPLQDPRVEIAKAHTLSLTSADLRRYTRLNVLEVLEGG